MSLPHNVVQVKRFCRLKLNTAAIYCTESKTNCLFEGACDRESNYVLLFSCKFDITPTKYIRTVLRHSTVCTVLLVASYCTTRRESNTTRITVLHSRLLFTG